MIIIKGAIYRIVNSVNDKVYIGQTVKPLEVRLKEHIDAAYKLDILTDEYEYDTKFYRAIRKYGKDKFNICLIKICNTELLNDEEIKYIKEYDSYKNGYNSTLGGGGNNRRKENPRRA